MNSIVQTGPESIELQQRARPTPGDGEVLLEVHTAGLCGSDAHAYLLEEGYEWIPVPRIMGHEYSAEVVEVGAGVDSFEVGEKVVEEPVRNCEQCFQCNNGQPNVCQDFSIRGMHRDGAYTKFVVAEPRQLHTVPDSVSLEEAAIAEPTSIATRAVFERSEATPGDDILVEGPGPIGVLVAAVADSIGANVVVSGLGADAEYRLPLLEALGVETVNVEEEDLNSFSDSFTGGTGYDVVFDTTGHRSGVEMAIDYVRKGGEIVVVGLPNSPSELFMTPVVRGEVDIVTSYGSVWRDFERALELMANGTIDAEAIIDTSYDVTDPEPAFEAFLNSETCKPVFSFHEL